MISSRWCLFKLSSTNNRRFRCLEKTNRNNYMDGRCTTAVQTRCFACTLIKNVLSLFAYQIIDLIKEVRVGSSIQIPTDWRLQNYRLSANVRKTSRRKSIVIKKGGRKFKSIAVSRSIGANVNKIALALSIAPVTLKSSSHATRFLHSLGLSTSLALNYLSLLDRCLAYSNLAKFSSPLIGRLIQMINFSQNSYFNQQK